MTPAELEARIRVEVEAAKADGFVISDGLYFTESGPIGYELCCCALGACARRELSAERKKTATERREDGVVITDVVGLSGREFISFIVGFDGCGRGADDIDDFYILGVSMRRLYVDGAT